MLFLSLLTNVLQFFIDMAASQPNKATMKGLEDGEGEMAGWWEKAAKKLREEDEAALKKKKEEELEEMRKEREKNGLVQCRSSIHLPKNFLFPPSLPCAFSLGISFSVQHHNTIN